VAASSLSIAFPKTVMAFGPVKPSGPKLPLERAEMVCYSIRQFTYCKIVRYPNRREPSYLRGQ